MLNIPFAVFFYTLFKSTSKIAAQIMVLAIVATTTIEAVNLFHMFSAMDMILSVSASGLPVELRFELAYFSLKGFDAGFGISLIFFGLVCLLYGWLIFKSALLPRFLAWLISLAGLCYLFNSYPMFLAPDFAASLFPFILMPCFIGELCLATWLTILGVNTNRTAAPAS